MDLVHQFLTLCEENTAKEDDEPKETKGIQYKHRFLDKLEAGNYEDLKTGKT